MKKTLGTGFMLTLACGLCTMSLYGQAAAPAPAAVKDKPAQVITEKEVTDLVDKAVALLKEKGDAALASIGTTNGDFHKGELYAFVYDENVNMLAHPEKPSLVGQNFKDKPDVKGTKFRNTIVENALKGGGWTEYYYQKPNSTGLFRKKVFSKLAEKDGKKYIVAVGMYVD